MLQCLKLPHRRRSACLAGSMWASCGSLGELDVQLTVAWVQLWSDNSSHILRRHMARSVCANHPNPVGDRSEYNASQGLRQKRKMHRELGPEPHPRCNAVKSGLTGSGCLASILLPSPCSRPRERQKKGPFKILISCPKSSIFPPLLPLSAALVSLGPANPFS